VLHHYDGWHGPDNFNQPVPGARGFLDEAAKRFRLVIFTTRAEGGVWDWLRRYNMEGYIAAVTNIKPLAVAYVDDRAVRFEGDWNRLFIDIERQPWWEKL